VNDIAKILTNELNVLKKDIQSSLRSNDRVASGKTSNSLRVEVKEGQGVTTGFLYGSEVLDILEEGRSSTKNASSSRTWEKELRDWMRIRGIEQDAFYPIWRKINREGYKGTPGLISNPIERFNKALATSFKDEVIKTLRNGIIR
jgi:hypothetical protein